MEKYGPRIEGTTLVDHYLIFDNEIPIGYIQVYKICAYPDYNDYIGADKRTAGIDMFIGERHYLNKGFGSGALHQFINQIVFQRQDIDQCLIGPEPTNKAAIRAYQKAGFQYFKTVQIPDQNRSEYLMRIDRAGMSFSRWNCTRELPTQFRPENKILSKRVANTCWIIGQIMD